MKKANFTSVASWVLLVASLFVFGTAANAQCTLTCNNLVQVSLDQDCDSEVTPDMIAEGNLTLSCPGGNFQVQAKINNVWVPASGNFHATAANINQTIQVRLRDLNSGNTCWGYIHVEDKLPPNLVCADITVVCAVSDLTPQFLRTADNPATSVCEGLGLLEAFPNQLGLNNVTYQGNQVFLVNAGSGTPIIDNCSAVTLSYSDTWFDLACGQGAGGLTDVSAYIKRVWTGVDASGNVGTCTQYIYLRRQHIPQVHFPVDATVDCATANANPNATLPANTGAPYILFGGCQFPLYPLTTYCEMNVTYTDQIIPVCDGTYKILRTWVVYDWCVPTSPFPPNTNPTYYIQLVKVVDTAGPEVLTPNFCSSPGNIHIVDASTSATDCLADVDLPDIIVTDNCSRLKSVKASWAVDNIPHSITGYFSDFPGNNWWNRDTMAVVGTALDLPVGNTTVQYTLTDDCGNSSTCTFRVRVSDDIQPTAVCTQYIQAALGSDGMVFVNASSFDQGSYDNCGDVYFKVRRMNKNDCEDSNNIPNNMFHDKVKFCCSDVGDTITVVFRVYDVTVDPGDVGLAYQDDHSNDCMVQVFVVDKIKPTCVAPVNVTTNCEAFDPSLWAYGYPQVSDNCCLDSTKKIVTGIATNYGVTESDNYGSFDTLCNRGTINRIFTAYDCHGLTNRCTQQVRVNYRQDYYVQFPDDKILFTCDGTTNFGEPKFAKKDCELLGVSYEDVIYTVVPDACYKIERTWTIINWCTYNPNLPCIYVPNPEPNALPYASANLRGPIVSACGTVTPWTATVTAILPGGAQVNYCDFWGDNTTPSATAISYGAVAGNGNGMNDEANCYKYKQIIKVIDTQKPICTTQLDDCDLTPNDPLFWNTMDWWDPIHGSHDLCEAPVNICVSSIDSCSGTNTVCRALVYLDLNGDGVMETVINTNNVNMAPPADPTLPNGFIRYGNAGNPNFGGGTLREFDHRPVPANLKYRFVIRDRVVGGKRVTCLMWTDRANPNPANNGDWVLPQIPLGKHKIKWFCNDQCGNECTDEKLWNLHDCKNPTVVCLNGLSVNIMPTKMIQLWATDFLQYAEDNCTPADQLVLSIRKSGTGTGFPVDANGNPIPGVTFTCSELGTQYVELWAKDKAGNASYCETYVIVQDPDHVCSPVPTANVAGATKVDYNVAGNTGVQDVQVNIHGTAVNPGQPALDKIVGTTNTGVYNFNAIPTAYNYNVTPAKTADPLNGVSTYDLLLISKHILGVEPLNTPYKMIAADANKSGSITTYDVLELRKLILGVYNELPSNTSWRFVDRSQQLDANNPFNVTLREVVSLQNLNANTNGNDFVSVKVGDVNGSAIPNNLVSSDDRSNGTLFFDVADRQVKAGETFTVNFKASEKSAAYQFTMNFNGLQVAEILPGTNMNANNFAVFSTDNALTASVDGDATEFAITFRATKDGSISKMISASSNITRAEANLVNGDRYEVAFRFNGNNGSVISGASFELFQNTPNPVSNVTNISFNLPEAANATLTISDAAGRSIKSVNRDFSKGINTVTFNRSELQSGILFYQLETATNSATKKMIVVE